MISMTKELKAKLFRAQSAEEIAALLAAAGEDASAADQIWREISSHRADQELSLDELEAVSGGSDRDWITDGCAATVEPDSYCGSSDSCLCWDVTYEHEPMSDRCEMCGTPLYIEKNRIYYVIYRCKKCGWTKKLSLFD